MLSAREQLEILKRGVAEIIDEAELLQKLERSMKTGKPLQVKLGLDPSAPDIHLGHAVVIRKMKQFQDLGHEVTIIIGDFTGMIGDPTGKSETRKQLSREEVEKNAATYKEQVFKILDPEKTKIRYNSEWLAKMNFADVIQLASKYTVARMMEREDFQKRFQENRPISIHEFFYPLMQGFDSVALRADVEMGATEQKFNILMGRTLQKEYGQEPQICFLMPILVGLDGQKKMSKSLGNYIGITDAPGDMYGKAMSIPDEVMIQYFELATDFPAEEVREMEAALKDGSLHPRDAKMKLARRIVTMYHGEQAAAQAEEEFKRIFQQRSIPEDIPEIAVDPAWLSDGKISVAKLLVNAGLAPSASEAKRLLEQGGVKWNDGKLTDPRQMVEPTDGVVIQVGKRKFARLRV